MGTWRTHTWPNKPSRFGAFEFRDVTRKQWKITSIEMHNVGVFLKNSNALSMQ